VPATGVFLILFFRPSPSAWMMARGGPARSR